MVQLVNADAVGDGQRGVLRKNSGAGVAFLFGGVPELQIAWKIEADLLRLKLGFLQTEEIGMQRFKTICKALLHAGAQAVDVPRDKTHIFCLPYEFLSHYIRL